LPEAFAPDATEADDPLVGFLAVVAFAEDFEEFLPALAPLAEDVLPAPLPLAGDFLAARPALAEDFPAEDAFPDVRDEALPLGDFVPDVLRGVVVLAGDFLAVATRLDATRLAAVLRTRSVWPAMTLVPRMPFSDLIRDAVIP